MAGARSFRSLLSFDKRMASLTGRPKQVLVLTRHFFERLFQNEIFPFEEQMKEKVIVLLALLVVLGGHVSNSILMRYMFVPDNGSSWLEKCFFISFFMALLAFATVLEWDVIFLDKKDFSNLRPLPIPLRTILFSKFLSFLLFIGLFSAAANALAIFVVAFYLPQWRSQSPLMLPRYMAVHLISALAANFFAFFFFVFLEALLMAFLSARLFQKLSLYIRFILLAGLIFLMMVFVVDSVSVGKTFSALTVYKDSRSPMILAFPPMWFVGLYEVLLGSHDPLYSKLAWLAVAGMLTVALLYFAAMVISYNRHLRKTLEAEKKPAHLRPLRNTLSTAWNRLFLRNSIQRAVFHFFGQTLRNSAMHKFQLAGYLATALGLILILLNSQPAAFRNMTTSNKNLLAVPLILSIALLLGVRGIVNVPLAAEANWIFRLTEAESKQHYFIGLKKAVVAFTIIPLFGILLVFFGILWGWAYSLWHCLYGMAVALWLMEFLFWKYGKLPFACLTVPGKARLHMLWWAYAIAILVFISLLSRLEKTLFQNLPDFPYVIAAMLTLVLLMEISQRLFVYRKIQIIYEEEPEPALIGLNPSS